MAGAGAGYALDALEAGASGGFLAIAVAIQGTAANKWYVLHKRRAVVAYYAATDPIIEFDVSHPAEVRLVSSSDKTKHWRFVTAFADDIPQVRAIRCDEHGAPLNATNECLRKTFLIQVPEHRGARGARTVSSKSAKWE